MRTMISLLFGMVITFLLIVFQQYLEQWLGLTSIAVALILFALAVLLYRKFRAWTG